MPRRKPDARTADELIAYEQWRLAVNAEAAARVRAQFGSEAATTSTHLDAGKPRADDATPAKRKRKPRHSLDDEFVDPSYTPPAAATATLTSVEASRATRSSSRQSEELEAAQERMPTLEAHLVPLDIRAVLSPAYAKRIFNQRELFIEDTFVAESRCRFLRAALPGEDPLRYNLKNTRIKSRMVREEYQYLADWGITVGALAELIRKTHGYDSSPSPRWAAISRIQLAGAEEMAQFSRPSSEVDISHRCGEPMCVAEEHVVFELHGTNCSRDQCHARAANSNAACPHKDEPCLTRLRPKGVVRSGGSPKKKKQKRSAASEHQVKSEDSSSAQHSGANEDSSDGDDDEYVEPPRTPAAKNRRSRAPKTRSSTRKGKTRATSDDDCTPKALRGVERAPTSEVATPTASHLRDQPPPAQRLEPRSLADVLDLTAGQDVGSDTSEIVSVDEEDDDEAMPLRSPSPELEAPRLASTSGASSGSMPDTPDESVTPDLVDESHARRSNSPSPATAKKLVRFASIAPVASGSACEAAPARVERETVASAVVEQVRPALAVRVDQGARATQKPRTVEAWCATIDDGEQSQSVIADSQEIVDDSHLIIRDSQEPEEKQLGAAPQVRAGVPVYTAVHEYAAVQAVKPVETTAPEVAASVTSIAAAAKALAPHQVTPRMVSVGVQTDFPEPAAAVVPAAVERKEARGWWSWSMSLVRGA